MMSLCPAVQVHSDAMPLLTTMQIDASQLPAEPQLHRATRPRTLKTTSQLRLFICLLVCLFVVLFAVRAMSALR